MVSNTSREAYHSVEKMGDKQRIVLGAIEANQPVHNERIADLLGWEINRVTGRVNELSKMGKIKQDGHQFTKSGRRAKAWVVV